MREHKRQARSCFEPLETDGIIAAWPAIEEAIERCHECHGDMTLADNSKQSTNHRPWSRRRVSPPSPEETRTFRGSRYRREYTCNFNGQSWAAIVLWSANAFVRPATALDEGGIQAPCQVWQQLCVSSRVRVNPLPSFTIFSWFRQSTCLRRACSKEMGR